MGFQLWDFGTDLTRAARLGRLDPVFGRDRELDRVIRVLARKTKNNPVLLGEPGVGKTAIVEGLAQCLVSDHAPPHLLGVTLFALNLGSLLAGTGYRGDFEQRLQELVAELQRPGPRRLLFVDELHLLGKAGRSEGGIDAGNLLKPLLARGELPCIGASTPDEWHELVARDPALERRFQPVLVPEPTATEAIAILRGLRGRFEQHHGVTITDDALAAAVEQAVLHLPNRRLPDKAVDLLDEACALQRLAGSSTDMHPDAATAEHASALAQACDRFDLTTFATLKRGVARAAVRPFSPIVDATTIQRVLLDQPAA